MPVLRGVFAAIWSLPELAGRGEAGRVVGRGARFLASTRGTFPSSTLRRPRPTIRPKDRPRRTICGPGRQLDRRVSCALRLIKIMNYSIINSISAAFRMASLCLLLGTAVAAAAAAEPPAKTGGPGIAADAKVLEARG